MQASAVVSPARMSGGMRMRGPAAAHAEGAVEGERPPVPRVPSFGSFLDLRDVIIDETPRADAAPASPPAAATPSAAPPAAAPAAPSIALPNQAETLRHFAIGADGERRAAACG